MLALISPAKKLNFTPEAALDALPLSTPGFQAEAEALSALGAKMGAVDLETRMKISAKLAADADGYFQSFSAPAGNVPEKPALFGFAGDTYTGLEARNLTPDALAYAQDHLLMLSGLYGLLRPLDRMRPHRLSMGTPFPTPHGKSLYDYWGMKIAETVDHAARAVNAKAIVCLASIEYFKAAREDSQKLPVITPQFKEIRPDGIKMISFFAKRARGAMARYIMENRITEPDDLKNFAEDGYAFQPGASDEGTFVFARAEQPSTAKTKPASPRIRRHKVRA